MDKGLQITIANEEGEVYAVLTMPADALPRGFRGYFVTDEEGDIALLDDVVKDALVWANA